MTPADLSGQLRRIARVLDRDGGVVSAPVVRIAVAWLDALAERVVADDGAVTPGPRRLFQILESREIAPVDPVECR